MKKTKQLSPVRAQKSVEYSYRKELNSFAKEMISEVRNTVLEYIKNQQTAYEADSLSSDLMKIFARLNSKFTGTAVLSFSNTVANKFVQALNKLNKKKFDQSFASASGVDLGGVIATEGLEDFIQLNIQKNVQLIKSLPEEYLKQVEVIVNNGLVNGAKYETIAKEIMSKTGASAKLANRIKTIARNETQTINAQLSNRRASSLGIKKGIYRTSEDEKVRKCHRELNGVEFEIAKGAWSKTCNKFIQPGITDINCRCSFSPIIEVE